jgi:hypothetical protein
MKAKTPKAPTVAAPVPVPQQDSPEMIDVKRATRLDAETREGTRASLLTPGGARGLASGDTQRKRLGYGAIASGF